MRVGKRLRFQCACVCLQPAARASVDRQRSTFEALILPVDKLTTDLISFGALPIHPNCLEMLLISLRGPPAKISRLGSALPGMVVVSVRLTPRRVGYEPFG